MWKTFKQWITQHHQAPAEIIFVDQILKLGGQEYQLNRALIGDVDHLLTIERAVYDGQTPWDRMAFMTELKKTHESLYLALSFQQKIIAFIGCHFAADESHITNIAVLPAYQDRGIGKFLMRFMISQAKQFPSEKLTLEVRVSNQAARHLYHELGFVDGKLKRNYYAIDHEDALDMTLPIEMIGS